MGLHASPAGYRGGRRELHPPLEQPGGVSDGSLVLSVPPHCLVSTQMVTPVTSKGMPRDQ